MWTQGQHEDGEDGHKDVRHGRQGGCRGLISQPKMRFWRLAQSPQQCRGVAGQDEREKLKDGAAFELGAI